MFRLKRRSLSDENIFDTPWLLFMVTMANCESADLVGAAARPPRQPPLVRISPGGMPKRRRNARLNELSEP